MNTKQPRTAFTLVEILIVVIILGILAAIVIPQFANASTDARKSALIDQLHQIRVQIQLYALQHGDNKPALTGTDWTPLTTVTTYQSKNYGPYIPNVPRNPLNQNIGIVVVASDPSFGDAVAGSGIGWVYNSNNGFMWGTNAAGDKVFNEANLNDPAN